MRTIQSLKVTDTFWISKQCSHRTLQWGLTIGHHTPTMDITVSYPYIKSNQLSWHNYCSMRQAIFTYIEGDIYNLQHNTAVQNTTENKNLIKQNNL